MSGKRRYIHIGYPKSASTSVQHTLLGNHPELYHLGNAYKGRNNIYIDDAVTKFAEHDVRYNREFSYNKEEAIAAFEPHFQTAETDSFKAVGLSSEFFCFTLSHEVDVVTKAKRLHEVFGDNTCIIIVFREQFSLLTSLYTEMVKGGYAKTFKKFLEYTYLFQDRSWCLEFCYDRMFQTYANLFGKDNICAVPFELLKSSEAEFKRKIFDALGVSTPNTQMKELNKQAPTLVFYEVMRRFNEKCPHEFGSGFYEPFAVMRMTSYFHNDLGVAVPQDNLSSDFLRMPLAKGAQQLAQQASHVPELDLNFPKVLKDRFAKIYAPSNAALAKMTGIDLAQYQYQLP